MKSIRAAKQDGQSWKQALYKFLRAYRVTPHSSTKVTPYLLLFGHDARTKLPQMPVQNANSAVDKIARLNNKKAKSTMKKYTDQKLGTKPSTLKVGDSVMVKQQKVHKLSSPYRAKPLVVVRRNGNMVTAQDGDTTITRNVSFFKVIRAPTKLLSSPRRRRTTNTTN